MSRAYVITGSREHDHRLMDLVCYTLALAEPDFLILGDCPTGVDSFALAWAAINHVKFKRHYADWRGPLGKKAGPARNAAMVAHGVLLGAETIAFPRGGPGTLDCMRKARRAGLPLHIIRSADDAERRWAPSTSSPPQSAPAGAARP